MSKDDLKVTPAEQNLKEKDLKKVNGGDNGGLFEISLAGKKKS